MKLYRGLKSSEYKEFNSKILTNLSRAWNKIIKIREKSHKYPGKLNSIINNLFNHERLIFQNFTDNKKIAESYTRREKGILLEINVPIKDIIKYFKIEFQNYTKRRKLFELIYVVKGIDLSKNSKKWKLKIKKF